jgi:hypothetical protein
MALGMLLPLVLLLAGCGGEGTSSSAPSGQTVELHPIAGGFEPNDLDFADCASAAEPNRCLEQAYGNLAYRAGPKPALRRIASEMQTKPEVESNCHRIVHVIGSASLARAQGDVGRAFTEGDSTCWSGYYHGILERALYGATNDTLLGAAVRRICAEVLREKTRFIAYQCVHGVGHGLMIQTGLDLPRSLEHCDRLETEWEQTSCDGGVFMENFNTSYGVKSRYVKDDDLLYPCNGVEERHKLYCYLQITDRVLGATGYDWKRAADLCTTAERAWRATCFQSFGRNASGVARLDQARLLRFCAIPARAWQGDCVFGAVRDIASIDAGGARALRFCSAVAERLQARCYYGLGTILSDLASDAGKLAVTCTAVPARYRPECRLLRRA